MPNCFARPVVLLSLILLAAVIANGQSSDKPKNEIEVRGTVSVPSGEANFSGNNDPGSTLDFNRDFDFKNEFGWEARYTYRSEDGKQKIQAGYSSTNWERTTTLTRSFNFQGQTFVASANVRSELNLRNFRGMYAYRWGNEKVRIGPMLDLGIIKTDLDITGTTTSGTREADGAITKFAATVGYDLDYDPTPKINIFNNLGAIAFHHDRLFHTEGGIKVFPSKHIGVVGGYKYQRYRWVNDNNFLRISSHGPFFGGVYRF